MNKTMRALVVGTAVAGAVIAAPGVADARTAGAGSTVHYQWTSDSVGNQITYIGKDGKQITKQVRFRPLPVGFSREQYGYSTRFRVTKRQNIAARIQSPQIYATCSIKVNGKQVAYRRALQTGAAR
jgi:hypothetical protein